MRLMLLILLMPFLQSVSADVFKCIGKYGAETYQPTPCDTATKQQALDIHSDPVKEEAAKARLDAVHEEYASRRAEQLQADKQAAAASYKAASLDIARRRLAMQQELAAARMQQRGAIDPSRRYSRRSFGKTRRHRVRASR